MQFFIEPIFFFNSDISNCIIDIETSINDISTWFDDISGSIFDITIKFLISLNSFWYIRPCMALKVTLLHKTVRTTGCFALSTHLEENRSSLAWNDQNPARQSPVCCHFALCLCGILNFTYLKERNRCKHGKTQHGGVPNIQSVIPPLHRSCDLRASLVRP